MKSSVSARNATLSALSSRLNNGYLRIYSGSRPTNADTAISGGNALLAELRFNATAFGSPSNGSMTANSMTGEDAILASGTASFARALQSDGSTVEHDFSISTASDGTGEVQLARANLDLTEGDSLNVSSFVISHPIGS